MAEITERPPKQDRSVRKNRSTRVDMTAMVDVAFLLLTFFILTTTMSDPMVMQLNVPPKDPDGGKSVPASKILTLILGENDLVHYYTGEINPEVQTTDFSQLGIRKIIQDHIDRGKREGKPLCGGDISKNCWDPIVVIKPNSSSRYKNLVDILDEMEITQAPKYALTDMTEPDSLLLAAKGLR